MRKTIRGGYYEVVPPLSIRVGRLIYFGSYMAFLFFGFIIVQVINEFRASNAVVYIMGHFADISILYLILMLIIAFGYSNETPLNKLCRPFNKKWKQLLLVCGITLVLLLFTVNGEENGVKQFTAKYTDMKQVYIDAARIATICEIIYNSVSALFVIIYILFQEKLDFCGMCETYGKRLIYVIVVFVFATFAFSVVAGVYSGLTRYNLLEAWGTAIFGLRL